MNAKLRLIVLVLTMAGVAPPAAASFTCDARGDTTSNGDDNFVYDFASRPVSCAGASSGAHAYDGNLKRVKTVSAGKTVYTVFSEATGGLIFRDQVTDNKTTDYISVGGAARRLVKSGSAVAPETGHFDAQGSARARRGERSSSPHAEY